MNLSVFKPLISSSDKASSFEMGSPTPVHCDLGCVSQAHSSTHSQLTATWAGIVESDDMCWVMLINKQMKYVS